MFSMIGLLYASTSHAHHCMYMMLITFVEPDIGLSVGLGLGVPAVVITVVTVACLIGYGKKE